MTGPGDYDSHVQSQPSVQFSQQSLVQPQSGQPSQQPLSLQQEVLPEAAGVVAANASTPVLKRTAVAREKIALVNMMKLTFWLIEMKIDGYTNMRSRFALARKLASASRLTLGFVPESNQPAAVENAMGDRGDVVLVDSAQRRCKLGAAVWHRFDSRCRGQIGLQRYGLRGKVLRRRRLAAIAGAADAIAEGLGAMFAATLPLRPARALRPRGIGNRDGRGQDGQQRCDRKTSCGRSCHWG